MEGITVVGGRMKFNKLTNQIDEKEYAVGKCAIWLESLRSGRRPIKWFKPNKQGTKMEFEYMRSVKESNDALAELKGFIILPS